MIKHIERAKLHEIKMLLISGSITYENAEKIATPYINTLNEKGKEIAKKHGRSFVKTTFSAQMR